MKGVFIPSQLPPPWNVVRQLYNLDSIEGYLFFLRALCSDLEISNR